MIIKKKVVFCTESDLLQTPQIENRCVVYPTRPRKSILSRLRRVIRNSTRPRPRKLLGWGLCVSLCHFGGVLGDYAGGSGSLRAMFAERASLVLARTASTRRAATAVFARLKVDLEKLRLQIGLKFIRKSQNFRGGTASFAGVNEILARLLELVLSPQIRYPSSEAWSAKERGGFGGREPAANLAAIQVSLRRLAHVSVESVVF